MVNDAIPYLEEADEVTVLPTAAITGKRFVVISGNRDATDNLIQAAPCGDNGRALGVAMWDAAIGKRVTVKTIESGMIMPVTAAAALAANQVVASDATGQARVAAAGERGLGLVVTGAAAGADAQIKLGRQAG
jgi:hypothetical protein